MSCLPVPREADRRHVRRADLPEPDCAGGRVTSNGLSERPPRRTVSAGAIHVALSTSRPPVASTRHRRICAEPREAVREWLSTPQALHAGRDRDRRRRSTRSRTRPKGFEAHLADFGVERLSRRDTFRFFRRLVNYDPARARQRRRANTPEAHLDYFVADSPVECHRDHLMVGAHAVKVLSMKEPPAQTFAHMLGDLLDMPGEFIACLEWQRLPGPRCAATSRRGAGTSSTSASRSSTTCHPRREPEDMLVDDSATAMVRQLGDALTEIEVNGHVFGDCSLDARPARRRPSRGRAAGGGGREGAGLTTARSSTRPTTC